MRRVLAQGAAAREPLLIFAVRGRLVRRLGPGERVWSGDDDSGSIAPSGVYLVKAGPQGTALRIVLVR